ncbi:MAG: Plasma membrane t-SNARE, secretory vesicle fusion [Chaenotheca gracillima]|nr:MAG: Plasma membrane t-SNARE, secretory vesicle fusion [Chaenotheca gracillima]
MAATMPSLSTPVPTNGASDPKSPVPLDTIPISPADGEGHAADDENAAPNGAKKEYGPDEQITVFHDAENFTVKHPLAHKWTLWFTKPPSGKGDNWNDLLKEVVTFDSVEEFWGVHNNITPTSELALKSDYHLFKSGVRPEWEDAQNKHGGKWAYQFKEKRNVPIDELWLHVMLAAIGETLENEGDGEVMGVVVNVRKGFYRIGLWTKTVGKSVPGGGEADVAGGKGRSADKGKDVLMGIGRRFRDVLRLRDSEQVEFSGHTESAHSGSSRAKAKYTV